MCRNTFSRERLLPLAVVGFITALTVYISGNEEHVITLVFAPIVVFWAISESERGLWFSHAVCLFGESLVTRREPWFVWRTSGSPTEARLFLRPKPARNRCAIGRDKDHGKSLVILSSLVLHRAFTRDLTRVSIVTTQSCWSSGSERRSASPWNGACRASKRVRIC